MFAIFRLEVNLPFLAAVLTTIGYSINDKIVIFDRIRENLRFAKLQTDADLVAMVNDSIWQTMARNINTVLVVLIAAGCLYLFGSESIKLFACQANWFNKRSLFFHLHRLFLVVFIQKKFIITF